MTPQLRRSRAAGRRSRNTRLVIAVTAALGTAFAGLPAAIAGPDDGKKILTREHIDAPYTVRDDAGVFDLYAKNGEGPHKLSESAVWVGKGYNSDGADKKQQYQFTVDDNERLRYLGNPGNTYVYSPETPLGGLIPQSLDVHGEAVWDPSADPHLATALMEGAALRAGVSLGLLTAAWRPYWAAGVMPVVGAMGMFLTGFTIRDVVLGVATGEQILLIGMLIISALATAWLWLRYRYIQHRYVQLGSHIIE